MTKRKTLYGATIALGSFLLFSVEPMAAKQLLPVLGGSSAVWLTCLFFFQTMLLAAYGVLLSRSAGQLDLVVGTPIANRPRVELEALIGFFVNTIPLRLDLAGAASFADFTLRVRQAAIDGYAHQDLPFEMMVEALRPQRDLSRSPLPLGPAPAIRSSRPASTGSKRGRRSTTGP